MTPTNTSNADFTSWRDFEKNTVTHSAAHYLMAIESLRREYGYARGTDVAERLCVSRGAASIAVVQLKKKSLVTEDPRRFLLLTEEGSRVVRQIEENFSVLSKLFEDVLGVPPEVAKADACKMEHLLSLETGRRLLGLLRFVLNDAERLRLVRKALSELCADDDKEEAYDV